MRFSLRTLLIALAIAGVVFARVAYLKRWRDAHQREAVRLIEAIRNAEGKDWRIADSVHQLAQAETEVGTGTDTTHTKVGVYNGSGVRWVKDSSTVEIWKEAIRQQAIANRFQRAMYRPWESVSEEFGPIRLPPDGL